MRGLSAVLAGLMLMAFSAGASTPPIDYENVGMVGVQRVKGQWVRLVRQKEICSLGKKHFQSDFAFVDVWRVDFEPDRLSLEIEFFRLRGSGHEVRECSIEIGNGFIGDLQCSLEYGSEYY